MEVSQAFEYAHELGMATILWCYLRNSSFKKDGTDYHAAADLTGQANHIGVTIKADIVKQKLPSNNGGFKAIGFGKTNECMYSELTTDHPIDLCRYQVANGYMGRVGLINSGGESHGESDLHDAVVTAVVNKRAGGMGLISGRKAFQKPMKDGVQLLKAAYTSYLKRAVKTLNCVLDRLDEDWIPVEKTWRLNEKHYGMLQGLNKSETAVQYGEEQVHIWRRSYDVAPAPVGKDDPRNPGMDIRYAGVPDRELPRTESLKDTIGRVMPYWKCIIFPALMYKDSLLVVAHGNSLRGIIKHLKGISDTDISNLNLPTAVPYVFEFDDRLVLVKDYYLGNPEEIRKRAEAVAKQGMAKK